MTLQEFFKKVPKAAVAFSGGADSAFLLWAARECGADVRAYYVKTAFQPAFELKDARRLARELQVPMTVIEEDILAVPEAAQNGPKRCYYCKRALFSSLREAACRDGYPVLLDGTNASDDAKDRPGFRKCDPKPGDLMVIYGNKPGQIVSSLLADPGHQNVAAPLLAHPFYDPFDLLRRLSLTVDHLRGSLTDAAVKIDLGIGKVFKGRLLQLQHGVLRRHLPIRHLAQQF